MMVIHGDTQVGIGYRTGGSKARLPCRQPAGCAQMRHVAAHLREASSENLELENGAWAVRCVPGPSVTVTEIALVFHASVRRGTYLAVALCGETGEPSSMCPPERWRATRWTENWVAPGNPPGF